MLKAATIIKDGRIYIMQPDAERYWNCEGRTIGYARRMARVYGFTVTRVAHRTYMKAKA
jgi:hypothetical protein